MKQSTEYKSQILKTSLKQHILRQLKVNFHQKILWITQTKNPEQKFVQTELSKMQFELKKLMFL